VHSVGQIKDMIEISFLNRVVLKNGETWSKSYIKLTNTTLFILAYSYNRNAESPILYGSTYNLIIKRVRVTAAVVEEQ